MKLNKAVARICSKRKAEVFIKSGYIKVDDKVVKDIFFEVNDSNIIKYKNKEIQKKIIEKIWLYNKPEKTIVSHKDNRVTIFDLIKEQIKTNDKIISIGRLDYLSRGLIIITNSSEYAHKMEANKNIKRVYIVTIASKQNTFTKKNIEILKRGMKVFGVFYKPINAKILVKKKHKYIIQMTLTEGKNREIRKIMQFFGFFVKSLERIQYGHFKLNKLKTNQLVKIK